MLMNTSKGFCLKFTIPVCIETLCTKLYTITFVCFFDRGTILVTIILYAYRFETSQNVSGRFVCLFLRFGEPDSKVYNLFLGLLTVF